jgi:hypothetical protein
VQSPLDRGQRDAHHGDVEQQHEHCRADQHQRPPLPRRRPRRPVHLSAHQVCFFLSANSDAVAEVEFDRPPDVLTGFRIAEKAHQGAHQFGSEQVHRRRIDYHAQHAPSGSATRSVRNGSLSCVVGRHVVRAERAGAKKSQSSWLTRSGAS